MPNLVWRRNPRLRSELRDAGAQPEQDAVLGDGGARGDEERHARLRRRDDLDLVAERVAHDTQPRTGPDRLAGADVRLPPAGLLRPQPDEAADELLRPLGRLRVAGQHAEHPRDILK